MESSNSGRQFVKSLHIPERIELSGFEAADDSVHMLEWMGRGSGFRQFVINDIEVELYSQNANAQLLSVNCKAKPNFETTMKVDENTQNGVVTRLFVKFPISLRVRTANTTIWRLDVEHSYQATNIDVPGEFQLRLNFAIIGNQIEA
ncbi:hypothetical protein [Rugamonas rubra]|uniref:hypothetical protein n=1 Tax=Rugamonas rubra TaxID=758825 RepID=UPI0011133042|nr:hypothetical protein [Rugamonas rubra]